MVAAHGQMEPIRGALGGPNGLHLDGSELRCEERILHDTPERGERLRLASMASMFIGPLPPCKQKFEVPLAEADFGITQAQKAAAPAEPEGDVEAGRRARPRLHVGGVDGATLTFVRSMRNVGKSSVLPGFSAAPHRRPPRPPPRARAHASADHATSAVPEPAPSHKRTGAPLQRPGPSFEVVGGGLVEAPEEQASIARARELRAGVLSLRVVAGTLLGHARSAGRAALST